MAEHPVGGSVRARQLLEWVVTEATERSAPTIEAEHVLLALAAEGVRAVRELLAEFGLDYDGVEAALAAERARSLGVVGIPAGADVEIRFTPGGERPRWGASIRNVLTGGVDDREAGREGRQRAAGGPRRAGSGEDGVPSASEARRPGPDRRRRIDDFDMLAGVLKADLGRVPRALAIAGVDRNALLARIRERREGAHGAARRL